LKTKKDTPKYGLIYHAHLIGQASAKLKGKASRMLAAKTSLAARCDALGEDTSLTLGVEHKAYLEKQIRHLEEGGNRRVSSGKKKSFTFNKYETKSEIREYSSAADSTFAGAKRKLEEDGTNGVTQEEPPTKKKKKSVHEVVIPEVRQEVVEEEMAEEPPKKKKKKRNH